ncbi:hypothetical protein CBU02nite_34840 [Clostridium butyricum]|uniref:Tryptophan synthase beta chain-like PALP domain-containing protein n=1 Tax=Clostridium butyricum TaxID=1492 RepID=A0A512TSQ1_CLOBU|nr:hypothetical protein CBU02nite_34840 [Clostridium butyricum]
MKIIYYITLININIKLGMVEMSKIYKNLAELVGRTPLLEVTNYSKRKDLKATIVAKLEYFNPTGSVKDRIAKAMI